MSTLLTPLENLFLIDLLHDFLMKVGRTNINDLSEKEKENLKDMMHIADVVFKKLGGKYFGEK